MLDPYGVVTTAPTLPHGLGVLYMLVVRPGIPMAEKLSTLAASPQGRSAHAQETLWETVEGVIRLYAEYEEHMRPFAGVFPLTRLYRIVSSNRPVVWL